MARVMDESGYHALWTAEHHFQHEDYECPLNLAQLDRWLATQTERLKFGCVFNVLPMWHPTRLAEDDAMADIVTGGRIIMGVGGGPLLDGQKNREMFKEGVWLNCAGSSAMSCWLSPPDSRKK